MHRTGRSSSASLARWGGDGARLKYPGQRDAHGTVPGWQQQCKKGSSARLRKVPPEEALDVRTAQSLPLLVWAADIACVRCSAGPAGGDL